MIKLAAARPWVPGTRIIYVGQLVVLAMCVLGSFGVLLSAVARTGDRGAFLHPGVERLGDPKDSMAPFGLDPLAVVLGWSRVAAFFVQPLAILAVLLSVPAVIPAVMYRDRRWLRRLGASTGAWVVLGAVACTPYGGHLLTWLLD